MILKKILSRVNPVEVIKALKKNDRKYMTKGILQMGGSGLLITSGIGLVTDGTMNESWYEIVGGGIMLLIGGFIAIALADKVGELQDGEKETEQE